MKPTRLKPGDVFSFTGTYIVNPEPETATVVVTGVEHGEECTTISFEPATPKDAEIIERHASPRGDGAGE